MKLCFLTAAFLLLPVLARAQCYTGPFGPDGSWNVYQVCPAATFTDASATAETMPCPLSPEVTAGHLVTFSSRAENLFVHSFCSEKSWIGLNLPPAGEAAAAPGWSWISGEAPAFENWAPANPFTLPGRTACVALNKYGAWLSFPGSRRQMPSDKFPYVVEWETKAAAPVPGATAYQKVWRDGMVLPEPVSGRWSLRWTTGYVATTVGRRTSFSQPKSIGEADALFAPAISTGRGGSSSVMISQTGNSVSLQPLLITYTQDVSRQGWLVPKEYVDDSFTGFPQTSPFIGAAVGKIHVEKAGAYTMAISAEDCFALRIGGIKWKAAHGDGYIDPLDPLTVTQPYGNFCAKVLATIDLPAGDHLVEALWMTQTTGSEFHVLSAPGEFTTEGATADWRALGYQATSGEKPRLGVTEAGWTVECSSPPQEAEEGKPSKPNMQEALIRLELEKGRITPHKVPQLNFAGVPGSAPAHFPDASAFPNAEHGNGVPQGPWALRAEAKLVVPQAGQYEIGIHACGLAAIRVPMAIQTRVSQMAQGGANMHMTPNGFDFDGRVEMHSEPKLVSTWSFDAPGEYDIQVFYLAPAGVSPSLSVFTSPFGPYPPALLSAGGAGISPDVPGLPLVTF